MVQIGCSCATALISVARDLTGIVGGLHLVSLLSRPHNERSILLTFFMFKTQSSIQNCSTSTCPFAPRTLACSASTALSGRYALEVLQLSVQQEGEADMDVELQRRELMALELRSDKADKNAGGAVTGGREIGDVRGRITSASGGEAGGLMPGAFQQCRSAGIQSFLVRTRNSGPVVR